ncbi:amino-acid permease BAT1 homolog [Quercus suber]|uniref:amino-acid permease BAT1 homolog n=1 Tax=Quercus suber TaxID=58331 RepID=UPI0032DE8EDC
MAFREVDVGVNPRAMEVDSGEKRLNELGYKQELRREMSLFKTFAITFSAMAFFVGTPLYGPSLLYAGPASLIWGYVVVTFFTWFVGFAMAEICSSFPCHERMQVIGGFVVIIGLPLISTSTQSASYVFTHFETSPEATGIHSKPYAIILSVLLSQYCLYGYDTAAHLTEETKGADRTGPMAILSCIGIISTFGWAYILALTFCIQDPANLFNTNNETAGALVPAQIIYDVFNQRYHSGTGAIIILCIIWGTFFFCGLSVITGAARVVYALSRDGGIPFSPIWTKLHPKYKNPTNAVWLCAAISIILGLPILKLNVIFTAILSISTVGWVGSYAVPIFARLVMDEKHFTPGPFYLGRASKPVCLISFIYICYTCAAFLLPTLYPLRWDTFNYAPIAISVALTLILLWWFLDARKWFKGPVRNIDVQNGVH